MYLTKEKWISISFWTSGPRFFNWAIWTRNGSKIDFHELVFKGLRGSRGRLSLSTLKSSSFHFYETIFKLKEISPRSFIVSASGPPFSSFMILFSFKNSLRVYCKNDCTPIGKNAVDEENHKTTCLIRRFPIFFWQLKLTNWTVSNCSLFFHLWVSPWLVVFHGRNKNLYSV